jgi:uncharacterized protein
VSPELSQLIELQELDLEIQRITDRLARIPVEREQVESEFRQYAAEFLELKSKHEQTLEDRTQLEAELATTQQHHDKYKQDLMRVTNQKQYETALREIDATKKQVGALESDILKHMEELEKLDVEMQTRSPDVDRRRTEADQTLAALDDEHQQLEQDLVGFGERRQQLASKISKPLFAAYDRLARGKRGQALAVVSNEGICMGCRVKVRPKVFSDVRRGTEMITCESCGRILYYRLETTQSV